MVISRHPTRQPWLFKR